MPDKREDKETRRQGDKETRRLRGFLLSSLSPCLLVPLSLFICILAAPTQQAQQQAPREQEGKAKTPPPISSHIVLITISGLRSDLVTGAESQRLNIPTIQALRTQGSYAVGIESVFPSQTLPAHASMITGSPPADHGVTSDYSFDQESASQSEEPRKSAKEIRTETLFDAALRAKLITATAGFPLTADATF